MAIEIFGHFLIADFAPEEDLLIIIYIHLLYNEYHVWYIAQNPCLSPLTQRNLKMIPSYSYIHHGQFTKISAPRDFVHGFYLQFESRHQADS
jgi:hypothetical protein